MIIDYAYISTRIPLKSTRIIVTWALKFAFFKQEGLKRQHIFVGERTESIISYSCLADYAILPQNVIL